MQRNLKGVEKVFRWTRSSEALPFVFPRLVGWAPGCPAAAKQVSPPASFYPCIARRQPQQHISTHLCIWHANLSASLASEFFSGIQPGFPMGRCSNPAPRACQVRPLVGFPGRIPPSPNRPTNGPCRCPPSGVILLGRKSLVAEDTGSSKTYPVSTPQHPLKG